MSTHLHDWRVAKGLTQQQLADKLGVGQTLVSYWEQRGVSVRHVRKVAELTGIPVEELLPRLPENAA